MKVPYQVSVVLTQGGSTLYQDGMKLVPGTSLRGLACRYSYLMGGREPQLFYDTDGYAAALLEACQTLKQPYAAPIYMRNRHMHLVSSTGLQLVPGSYLK